MNARVTYMELEASIAGGVWNLFYAQLIRMNKNGREAFLPIDMLQFIVDSPRI